MYLLGTREHELGKRKQSLWVSDEEVRDLYPKSREPCRMRRRPLMQGAVTQLLRKAQCLGKGLLGRGIKEPRGETLGNHTFG